MSEGEGKEPDKPASGIKKVAAIIGLGAAILAGLATAAANFDSLTNFMGRFQQSEEERTRSEARDLLLRERQHPLVRSTAEVGDFSDPLREPITANREEEDRLPCLPNPDTFELMTLGPALVTHSNEGSDEQPRKCLAIFIEGRLLLHRNLFDEVKVVRIDHPDLLGVIEIYETRESSPGWGIGQVVVIPVKRAGIGQLISLISDEEHNEGDWFRISAQNSYSVSYNVPELRREVRLVVGHLKLCSDEEEMESRINRCGELVPDRTRVLEPQVFRWDSRNSFVQTQGPDLLGFGQVQTANFSDVYSNQLGISWSGPGVPTIEHSEPSRAREVTPRR